MSQPATDGDSVADVDYSCSRRSSGATGPDSFEADAIAASRVCPECAESVKVAARVCRFCGYRFDGTPQRGDGHSHADAPRVAADTHIVAVILTAAFIIAISLGVLAIGVSSSNALDHQAAIDDDAFARAEATGDPDTMRAAAQSVHDRGVTADDRGLAFSGGFVRTIVLLALVGPAAEFVLRRRRRARNEPWNANGGIRISFLILGVALIAGVFASVGSDPGGGVLVLLEFVLAPCALIGAMRFRRSAAPAGPANG